MKFGMRLKLKIRLWLGIEKQSLDHIALQGIVAQIVGSMEAWNMVSVEGEIRSLRPTGNATIIALTPLNGGRVHIKHVQFDSVVEIERWLRETENRFSATAYAYDLGADYGKMLHDRRQERRMR